MQIIYIFIFLLAVLVKGFFNQFISLLPLLVMAAGILHYGFFRKNKLFVGYLLNKKAFFTYAVLIVLTMVAIIRNHSPYVTFTSNLNDILWLISFSVFLYISFSHNYYKKDSFYLGSIFSIKNFILAASSLSVLFFVLYLFASPRAETGVILKAIGINFNKRHFPLIDIHPNLIGIYNGGIVVMQVLYLFFAKDNRKTKIFIGCMTAICFTFLLFTDSRGTLLNTIFSIALIFMLHRLRALKTVKFAPFLIPGLPLIFLFILPILAQSELGSKLSRGKKDLDTGNSRALVWEYCFDEISDVKPIHFIGYGENGQYPAGVSIKYGKFFGIEKENKYMVTHNNFLQLVFDQGYIGLIVMLLVLAMTLTQLIDIYNHGYTFSVILIGLIIYFIFSGTTESIYGTYNRIYLYLILGVILTSNILYNEFQKHLTSTQS